MKFKDTRRGFMKFLPSKIVLCRRKKRERRKSLTGNSTRVAVDDSRCACCLKPFLIGRGVECRDCGVRSCRKVCSHRDVAENTWHCLFCHQRRSWLGRNEEWFETFGGVFSEDELNRYFNTAESSVCVQEVEDNESPRLDLDLAMGGQKEQEENSMEAVRDFIEQIVRSLVGDVNDAPIDRLYNHPAYKPSTDSPTMAHMALRELVERAVEEARKLPGLGGSREVTEKSSQDERNSIVEHSYEDLLATAILNKVIEKFQNERVDGNSNVLHEMPSSRTKCGLNENEFGLDEGVDEGSSSLEPLSQDECSSDCSVSRSRYFRSHQEPLSLTIEERIEEVTTTYTSDEDLPNGKNQLLNIRRSRRVPFPEFGMDIVDPSQESSEDSQDELDGSSTGMMDLITPSESWEENWLFQRKKTGAKADSVAMLVPHPSAEFKALIGDKDAEDTSDLSECSAQSDEEIEKELMEAIQNVIPRSPKQAPEGHDFYNDDDDNNDDNENADHQAMIELQNLLASPREELENHDDKFESKEKPVVPGLQGVDQSFCSTDKVNLLVQSEKLKSSKHRENLEVEVEVFLPKTEEEEDSMIIERNFTEDEYTRHHAVPMYISYNEDSEMPTATAMTKNPDHEDVKGSTITTTAVEGLSNRESSKSRDPAELYKPVVTTSNAKETPKDEKNSLNLLATPPRPGTIAEREHKKWENAVPIENNPYSEENIQRRLLERQYARRSSDISNSHAEPPKNASITNNDPVDIILESNRPDIKRFSRDYYINNAKVSSGDRSQRSPLTVSSSCSGSSSSRPSSSLSQESGSDLERQERTTTTTTTTKTPQQRYNDKTTNEITKWQRNNNNNNNNNNIEMNKKANGLVIPPTLCDYSDPELCENQQEDLLENERKNSKNEINAKLNNQDLLDAKKPYFDDNSKRQQLVVRRLDLKAYGFENEFGDKTNANGQVKISPRRTVNKLDLKSFGYYEDGSSSLRRARSVNHLDFDSADRSELKKRLVVTSNDKSNLLIDKSYDISQDNNETQTSYENQNFMEDNALKSAKSVPNIASIESYDDYDETPEKSIDQSGNDTAANNKYCDQGRMLADDDSAKEKRPNGVNVDAKLPLPSVKKLAQAFGKNCDNNPVPAPRLSKSSTKSKGRSTPEIHIIETPRQMHSLTARSLSKQFREGLRQLSTTNKVPSSKTSHNITNDQIVATGTTSSKLAENNPPASDIESIISPGKLKSNIKFWEQLQNKN